MKGREEGERWRGRVSEREGEGGGRDGWREMEGCREVGTGRGRQRGREGKIIKIQTQIPVVPNPKSNSIRIPYLNYKDKIEMENYSYLLWLSYIIYTTILHWVSIHF